MTETPDNDTSNGIVDQIKANPGLAIAGAVAVGVLVSALLPKGSARRLAKGAVAAAAVGSEAGLALAKQARERAANAADGASEQLEKAGAGARHLRQRAAAAGGSAASAGLDLTRTVINMLASLRR